MNAKRIAALCGVILIALLWIATLILAVTASPNTVHLFLLSLLLTVMIPIIIHLFLMMYNARKGRSIMSETYTYRDKDKDEDQAFRS